MMDAHGFPQSEWTTSPLSLYPLRCLLAKSQLRLFPDLLLPAALVIVITLFSGILCKLMKNECSKKKSCFHENQVSTLETVYESQPQKLFWSAGRGLWNVTGKGDLRNLERCCKQRFSDVSGSSCILNRIRIGSVDQRLAKSTCKGPENDYFWLHEPHNLYCKYSMLPL